VYLFDKTMHYFKMECAGYLGPITFNCWHIKNSYVDFKVFLSLKHQLPNAKNCMKSWNCSKDPKKHKDRTNPLDRFSFNQPDQKPFSDDEVLYISFYSELGCKIIIDPLPVRQVFANKRVQDAQRQQEGDGP